jgi:IS30 family transposase
VTNNKDLLMISEKTLYTYIAAGMFSAESTDLRCKVKMKRRESKPILRIDRACMAGRTREDFLAYMDENPDTAVIETDSVIGKKGDGQKVLLTIHFPHSGFMLAFIRDANTSRSVSEVFFWLKMTLGIKVFRRMFPVIIVDRGSEFTNPIAIEQDEIGQVWTRLFYCDPYSSFQKPHIENNHRMLRMISPKGVSLNPLTQDKVNLMMSHINSYAREALGDRAPIDVFAGIFGEEVVNELGLRKINPNDIVLKPSLIK